MTTAKVERITFLTASYPRFPGGGSRVYFEHANQLARRGYDVSIVHPLGIRPNAAGLADRVRNKVRDIRSGHLRQRISWVEIHPDIEVVLVDRLDEHTPLPHADLRIGTYWRTIEILGARRPDGAARLKLIQAYETWAGPPDRVDATWQLRFPAAVVSRSLLQRGLDLGVPREYLHLVPNGIDHSVFRITRPIADRAPCIALLAHEPAVKGLPDAIETVRLVRERRPDTEVISFGGGPRPAILPSGITYLQRPVGHELAEQVYNRASVFLCTSLSEGFGFPSLEAMACGAALVSTANGGVDEFARHGESALICPVGDTAALAESVLALLSDDALRLAVTQQGVRSAARFSWDASGDAFHAAVRAALEHDRGAA